jgi:hypothetical protein
MSSVFGLKARPHTPKVLPARSLSSVLAQLADQDQLLGVVDALGAGDDLEAVAVLAGGGQERADVLGEARAAVADAGEQELGADARVGAHAAADQLDVGADAVGQVGHVVHERDAGREVGVAGVLGELGRARVHEDDAVVGPAERLVEAVEGLARCSSVVPMMMRSGCMKSSTAAPSLRNSGLETTTNGCLVCSAMMRAMRSAVPTGTVLLSTMIAGRSRCRPISAAA